MPNENVAISLLPYISPLLLSSVMEAKMNLTDLRKDPVYITTYIVCNTFVMGESTNTLDHNKQTDNQTNNL